MVIARHVSNSPQRQRGGPSDTHFSQRKLRRLPDRERLSLHRVRPRGRKQPCDGCQSDGYSAIIRRDLRFFREPKREPSRLGAETSAEEHFRPRKLGVGESGDRGSGRNQSGYGGHRPEGQGDQAAGKRWVWLLSGHGGCGWCTPRRDERLRGESPLRVGSGSLQDGRFRV